MLVLLLGSRHGWDEEELLFRTIKNGQRTDLWMPWNKRQFNNFALVRHTIYIVLMLLLLRRARDEFRGVRI